MCRDHRTNRRGRWSDQRQASPLTSWWSDPTSPASRPLTREDLELAFANVAVEKHPPWFCLPSAVVDQMTETEVVLYARVQMEQWVFGMSHPGAVDRLRAVVERIEAGPES